MKQTKTLAQLANDIESGNNLHEYSNGFAPSKGFPVDADGGTVNDRDYLRDKDAQMITRKIAAEYDARAIQSPVIVSRDGVVLSINAGNFESFGDFLSYYRQHYRPLLEAIRNGDTLNEQQRHILNFMADDFIKMFWDKE